MTLWWLSGLAFAVHFLAFSFYTPVAPGARFIMSTWLPVLFALATGIESMRQRDSRTWKEALYQCFYLVMTAALLRQLLLLWQATVFGEVRGATQRPTCAR